MHKRSACLDICLVVVSQLSVAQESRGTGEPREDCDHSEFHKHVIAFFAGVAHQGARDNGLALGIEAGKWEIAPQLDLDLVDGEETWVLGVTYGKGL